MTDEVARVYEEARQLPREARDAFVGEACRGNPALREEVDSLLSHADAAERFFDRLGGAVRAAVPPLARETARHIVGDWSASHSSTSPASSAAAIEQDPMVGTIIGRYRVLGLLGRGGMGTVYRAHDGRLNREIALKFLPPHVAGDQDAADRFLAEARAAAALTHPNVCTVHEISETDDGRPFIAMALYEGETLKQRLTRGPLPPRDAATIARDLARALGAAHERGIVHRDVKPGNVMLARDGQAKLLDFGLALVGEARRTATGVIPGTIAYMSPEQARGDALDHRSDLWSLGVVLYEMLTGARPFRATGDRATLHAILHDPAGVPNADAAGESPELWRIVERLLRKDPNERYSSAAAVESDLADAIGGSDPAHDSRFLAAAAAAAKPGATSTGRVWRRAAVIGAAAVAIVSASLWSRGAAREPAPAISSPRSLAVLPFNDLSTDSADRYFSEGLSEEIATALGRIEGLQVAARTSAFALRDRGLDVRRIGDTLGVGAVLEGTVRRAGRRLRVTVQLVDTHTGLKLWSNEYDREMVDVIAVQDEIARAIAVALELRLPSTPRGGRVRSDINLAAYDLYLRALPLRNSMSSEALQRATDLLDRAIELQSDFALAYATKATVVAPRIHFRQIPQDEGLRELRAAMDHAFAIDSQLGEAHVARGIVQLFFDLDYAGAERSLRRAIELNPNDSHAWHHLGNYLRAMGRLDEAAEARQRGIALDPLNPRLRITLAEEYFRAGKLAEALPPLERGLQLDPLHPIAIGLATTPPFVPGRIYLSQGREAEGVQDLLRAATLRGATLGEVDALRAAFATGGVRRFWRRWLIMDQRLSGGSLDPMRAAALSALAGDTAKALTWLEQAYEERNSGLIFMRTEPAFVALRTNQRYLRVERAMHFPSGTGE